MGSSRIVVVGTAASNPYAGMAWMSMQFVVGLLRSGHDAYYFEITSNWPYDPNRNRKVCDSEYAVPYLARLAEDFGFGDRWAYRRSYSDKAWVGLPADEAEALLADADAVLNLTGATRFAEEGLEVGRLVYLGTDPIIHELGRLAQDEETLTILAEHDDFVTYGENLGTAACPVPPLPNLSARTRQPILVDMWADGPPSRRMFTTVGNWEQEGRDVEFGGTHYLWSKHHEFERVLDLPSKVGVPLELAMNLADPASIHHGEGEVVRSQGMSPVVQENLKAKGWNLVDARSFSTDPWSYRRYIRESAGEFTVARDLNVRLRSGWFSERSACYLAAGRPVVTQDTGFGEVLPTGEGLFSFSTEEEAATALEKIAGNYERHSRAAQEIASEYFRAEKVLSNLLDDLGI